MGKKRHKYDDYVDLGAGYDENDSFIDNTDAVSQIRELFFVWKKDNTEYEYLNIVSNICVFFISFSSSIFCLIV